MVTSRRLLTSVSVAAIVGLATACASPGTSVAPATPTASTASASSAAPASSPSPGASVPSPQASPSVATASAAASNGSAFEYAATIPDSVDGKPLTKTMQRFSDPEMVDPADTGGVGKMVAQFGQTLDDFTVVTAKLDEGDVVFEATRLPGVDAKLWTRVLDEAAYAQGLPSPIATETIDGRTVVVSKYGPLFVYRYNKGDVSYRINGATREEATERLAMLP